MMLSKVPDAINELIIPFSLPNPLSFKVIKPGTMTEGLIQDIVYLRAKHITRGISKCLWAMKAIVRHSNVYGIKVKKTTSNPFPVKVTCNPPLIRRIERQILLIYEVHTDG